MVTMNGIQTTTKNALLAWLSMTMMAMTTLAQVSVPPANFCRIQGRVFQRGQTLPGEIITTRCGPAADYPCFCNPEAQNQIECPYCGFATNTENYLRCARDGEIVQLIGVDNVGKSCTCDASDPLDPKPLCEEDPSAEVCTISLPDGSTIQRLQGQEIGRESRCGSTSEYPCYCNPNLPGQIECPYCSFPARDGDDSGLECLRDNETRAVLGLDGNTRSCSCTASESLAFPFVKECDGPSTQAPVDVPGGQCAFVDDDGEEFFVDHGAVLTHLYDERCGPDWPCYCNTLLDNQIECPYCAVPVQGNEDFLCGLDKDVLQIPQEDGTTFACQCQVDDPLLPPALICGPGVDSQTCLVDLPNGQQTTVNKGDEVDFPVGVCGSKFPFICNPDLVGTDKLEYPYCEYETRAGITCARTGTNVEFYNTENEKQSCDCLYINENFAPQSSCKTVTDPPKPSPPTPAPVVRSNGGEDIDEDDGFSTGLIVGIVLGGLLLLAVSFAGVAKLCGGKV